MSGLESITAVLASLVSIAGGMVGVLRWAKARNAVRPATSTAISVLGRQSNLIYSLPELSRLYAKEPGVTLGYPYAVIKRWLLASPSGSAPFIVRMLPGKFVLDGDRPDEWRAVRAAAFESLGRSGHDMAWSEPKIRIAAVSRSGEELEVQEAEYDDQRRSNLIVDYRVGGMKTLREMLQEDYPGRLPPLSDARLANTLGIAVMVVRREGQKLLAYCVRRARTGVAVFEGKLNCSASGSARWPDGANEATFLSEVESDMLAELDEEVGLKKADLCFMRPVALARELVRAGKPELFFVAGTLLSEDELRDRRHRARSDARATSQPVEIEEDSRFVSAASFLQLPVSVKEALHPDMSHQAAFLLTELSEGVDQLLSSPDWAMDGATPMSKGPQATPRR